MKSIKRAYRIFILIGMAFLLVCPFVVSRYNSDARDSFASKYMQKVYNQTNGIGSNEVKCLYQSSSGYIWLGTDGGLYRSNGSEFTSINLWNTDRTDVYSINCIYQDTKGRMWIGTDNYGLFYIENGENHHLLDEYYDGIKQIFDVCQDTNGRIYVSTGRGIYICEENSDGVMALAKQEDDRLLGADFSRMCANGESIWAVSGNRDVLIIKDGVIADKISLPDEIDGDISCIKVCGEKIYVGTSNNNIIVYKGTRNYQIYAASVEGINSIMLDTNERLWICADTGIGFFDSEYSFYRTTELEIDSYISDIIQDYEGNFWIASTRFGVLYLSRSKFVDFNMSTGMPETMVNCVLNVGKDTYIGADDGLTIYDKDNNKVENELTDMLNGISVKYIMKDSKGTLWIGTHRRFGIVRVASDGTVTSIGRTANMPSSSINYIIELNNGNMAVATDSGVAILKEDGSIIEVYGSDFGIDENNILCLYQTEDGKIFAGSDGSGLYVIDIEKKAVSVFNSENGINSEVITTIRKGENGIWIGTDNGLCYYNEAFRSVGSIDVSNSIFDIIVNDGVVWIIGSKGIIHATEEELLGSQSLNNRYFDKNDGLNKTLNTISNSVIDSRGIMYICCNTGLYTLDTNNILYNYVQPRIRVTSVDVDGEKYEFDDLADGLRINSDTSRISIKFAVFSYTNRENIRVEYSLNGFDENPVVLSGTDSFEAVYTNLKGGTYEFVISATNGDNTMCDQTVSFIIDKKKSFFENPLSRVVILLIILVAIMGVVHAVHKMKLVLQTNTNELEKLSKEHEAAVKSSSAKNDYLANMSNEIKTPINAMMVKADELLKLLGQDSEYYRNVKSIYDTGEQIIDQVDDIILLAKLEAGKVELIRTSYSVTDMMYELSEYAVSLIAEKPVKFYVEIGENLSNNVVGDVEKIKDVLSRIVENAVKYTREGSITLSVDSFEYTDKNHQGMINLIFTISDTGIGIQEDRIDTLFEVYSIDDNRKSGFNSGNGIGLAIAKQYADIMEAELSVESVYGAGSTFTLSVNQRMLEKSSRNMNVVKIDETLSREDVDKLWLPDVCALIVDDDDLSREVAIKALSKFEMKIDGASSGLNAIDMVMNNSYDVVFMDLSMPIMNGIDAMREIRELDEDRFSVLPIISMDNDAIEDNKANLLEKGFTDSLTKPIDIKRVAAILKDCLPMSKIKEKTSDIGQYIKGSRFGDGLVLLEEYLDVEAAVEKIGGSIDVYNKLLSAYYYQNATAASELTEKFPRDIRGFKAKIHTIKTSSTNIGAYSLAQEATKIEAAINIGNKDYTRDNLRKLVERIDMLIKKLSEYMDYMDSVSGLSDEEYAERIKQKNAQQKEDSMQADLQANNDNIGENTKDSEIIGNSIDIATLGAVKFAALDNDFEDVENLMEDICSHKYTGEDGEFLEVLKLAIDGKDIARIDELITTYKDLKM